jgi:hypothetical protein
MTAASMPAAHFAPRPDSTKPSSTQMYLAKPMPDTLHRRQHKKSRILTAGESAGPGTIFAVQDSRILPNSWRAPMGEVVRLVSKSELERARLIREAPRKLRAHLPAGRSCHRAGGAEEISKRRMGRATCPPKLSEGGSDTHPIRRRERDGSRKSSTHPARPVLRSAHAAFATFSIGAASIARM